MTEVERIADQLKRAFEGEAWHGPSVKEILKGVDAKLASRRPIAGAHTIWEIVLHINAWQNGARRRVEGEEVNLTPQQDWPSANTADPQAWDAAVEMMESSYRDLHAAVMKLTDSELTKTVPAKEYTIYFVLHGVIQHDLFHAGQIAVLKK